MKPREFLDFLERIETLKTNTRHCTTKGGMPETVAAHSWRIAVMALLLTDTFPELDMNKVMKMCLIHDFGEAVTGDIPSFLKTGQNEATETDAVDGLLATLPEPQQGMLTALYVEMDAQQTQEARIYKALDKLEAVIQHNESDISTWIPLEFMLNRT
ncbi:MAG: HD domain-containing protein, partial [Clostridia bacterium]